MITSFKLIQRALSNDRMHIAVLTLAIWILCYLLQYRLGFSLWDEGFLWYGVQRVLAGEIPIRDFMAYDFGRYYWSAIVLDLLGDPGILSLRHTVAVFHAAGLVAAVLLITRGTQRWNLHWVVPPIVILILWSYPRYKLFDTTLSISVVGIVAYLIAKPSMVRCFAAGVGMGLIAIFGRNHGLYGALSSMGALVYLRVCRQGMPLGKGFASWVLGASVGYLPMVILLMIVPGLTQAFWESIRVLLENKATNLPLPIPWPWRVQFSALGKLEAMRQVLIGLFFMALPMFAVIALAWVLRRSQAMEKTPPVLIASSLATMPYAHYAFSRSDLDHLALGIFPFLVGILSVLETANKLSRLLIGSALLVFSLVVMAPVQPLSEARRDAPWKAYTIGGDDLLVAPNTAADLDLLKVLVERYAPADRAFIAAPFWPGAYAVFERRSPMWEIYALLPRGSAFQLQEIKRIQEANPGFAVIMDLPFDGRDDLRFRNTHPLIDRYIRDNFDSLTDIIVPPVFQVYKNREDNR